MKDSFTKYIKPGEFCALSTTPQFHKWLKDTDDSLYNNLIDHLKLAKGCNANAQKMIELVTILWKSEKHRISLLAFLRANYPLVLVEPADYSSQNYHNVFVHYDPTLNTIPRRKILTVSDAAISRRPLSVLVDEFCGRQAYCDYVEIDDRVYIEYLPPELGHLVEEIPKKNWQVATYRTNIGR